MSEKTEPPTPKKQREAREKGQVAKSRDLVQAVLFLALLGVLLGNSGTVTDLFGKLILLPADLYSLPFPVALREFGLSAIDIALVISAPVIGATIIAAIAGNVLQTGFLLAAKALKPDLGKLNPGAQLKNMFSAKSLIEFAKSLVKIIVLTTILYVVVRGGMRDLLYSVTCGLYCVLGVAGRMLNQVVITAGGVFLIVAAADYFLQRSQHMKQLRMSKDEVKREYKEMEGEPLIKSKRKQLHQEIMMEDTRQRVRQSSVLITNPTEIAVAIHYDSEKTPLPVVIAKGEGLLARRMMQIAREEGIPILENIPLARSLHYDAPVDQYIPSSLIEPVAEVLRWVQSLKDEADA
ncbi:MAG: type III secretion system export apparatus subunit SctU [Alphaproteobacteria bacterium]|nr:type III secretion system export apparatus subunit SctU [Alphaproteobacteria bacterium]